MGRVHIMRHKVISSPVKLLPEVFHRRSQRRSRLGIALSHYSNLGLGDRNPGSETVNLYYSLPLGPVHPAAE